MTPDITIRSARRMDATAIAAIYAPHCTEGLASFETAAPSADDMGARMAAVTGFYPWLVAVDAHDRVLGYAYASRHRDRPGYRWSVDVAVYVAVDETGRGVGRRLYTRLLPLLEAQGLHRAYAGIALPNDASVALHRATGFEAVGVYREVGFKHGAWLDVQWWSRGLAELSSPPGEPIAMVDLPPEHVADLG